MLRSFVRVSRAASFSFFVFVFFNSPLYAARGSSSRLQTSNLQLSPQPLQLLHADRRLILQECNCARIEPGGKKRGFPLLSCLSLGLPAAVSASSMFLCTDLHPLHTHARMHALTHALCPICAGFLTLKSLVQEGRLCEL